MTATVQEIIAAAQALTRDRRHLDGLLAEVAEAPVVIADDAMFVKISPALLTAIRRRAWGEQ